MKWSKSLLPGGKFILELFLRQSGFNYSAFRLFTKNCERIKRKFQGEENFKETGN